MQFKKPILLLFSLIALSGTLSAQYVYTIKADSVKLTNCDSTELIIENHSQAVPGFLFNTGNGRTKFQRGAIKINDSMYLIGADTLRICGSSAIAGNNVYYVNRNFSGPARAVISGNTLASVSSTNAGYTAQLSKAVPGNMLRSYPDPFSARNAALDAISAGTISNAEIVILEGNKYTIGSNDSTKNGSTDGAHPNNGTVADIQFPSTVLSGGDTSIVSIMKNNIDMYFSQGTNLTYINSSFPIFCVYNDATTSFNSNIYGSGSFYQVYGEGNGFAAYFLCIENPLAVTGFHAAEVILQQYNGFTYKNYSLCNVDIENLLTTDADVFIVGRNPDGTSTLNGNIANAARQLNIRIKNVRYGKGQTPYPDSNDTWYFIIFGENKALQGTMIKIDIGNFYMLATDNFPLMTLYSGCTLYNTSLTVNIDNLIHRNVNIPAQNMGLQGGLIGWYFTNICNNTDITFNIKSAHIQSPLLGMMNLSLNAPSKNNRVNINVGELLKDSSAFVGGLFDLTNQFPLAGDPAIVSIRGNFKSYDNKPLIYAYNTVSSFPFANHYIFSGKYETAVSGMPVCHFHANMGKMVSFTDAYLLNDGTTDIIKADSTCDGIACDCCQAPTTGIVVPVYIRNVHANAGPATNIQQYGDTIKVVADLPNFIR